jgi:aspartate-semialdehyde dehydrogenase
MLKVAVIGTGFIGSVHTRNIARHPGTDLVAVNDANFEFAKKAATATGTQAVADIAGIFDNKNIGAVVIATPTNTHVEYLTRASSAGKAIASGLVRAHRSELLPGVGRFSSVGGQRGCTQPPAQGWAQSYRMPQNGTTGKNC